MNEKEFLYAARCHGGQKSIEKVQKYISENPKGEYSTEDWLKAMEVERGFKCCSGAKWTNLGNGNKTTCYKHKGLTGNSGRYQDC